MLAEKLLSLDESISVILASVSPVETERAGVINTPGRTLAEDVPCDTSGEVLLPSGTVIGASEMGLLAELGRPGVLVSRRPRVSLITSGEEFVDLMEEVTPGRYRNVNRYSLAGRILSAGCEIGRLIHAGESPDSLKRAIYSCRVSDAIVLTDGAAEGKQERVRAALAEMDGLIFSGLAIEPGGNTSFSIRDGKPIFSLPGDPWGAAVVFEVLVRPALLKMLRRAETSHPTVRAVADDLFAHARGVTSFFAASTTVRDTQLRVRKLNRETTTDLVQANSLAMLPEGVESVDPGSEIDVLLPRTPLSR